MVQFFNFKHHILPYQSGGGSPQNDEVNKFYASLTGGLESLDKSVGTQFLSFEFVEKAIDFLRSIHTDVILLVDKLRLPVSAKDEDWLNEYMDETVKILDVCNVLKVGVSRLEQYQMLVELVVRALDANGNARFQAHRGMQTLNACKQEMLLIEAQSKVLVETKIEAEGMLAISLNDKHAGNKFVRWNGFWGIMFSLKNTSSYVCRLLLSAVVCAGALKPSLNLEGCSFKSPWSCALAKLDQSVSEQVAQTKNSKKDAVVLSFEVDVLQATLADLRVLLVPFGRPSGVKSEEVEKLKHTVVVLKEISNKFQTGLEAVDWHLNDLFDVIVEGRNKLLNVFSSCSRELKCGIGGFSAIQCDGRNSVS